MIITWNGGTSFKVQGREATAFLDPLDPQQAGVRASKVTADVVTLNDAKGQKARRQGFKPGAFFIDSPGEYEVKGVLVYGVQIVPGRTAYVVEVDGMSIAHLGGISGSLDATRRERFSGADILLLPVGDKQSLTVSQAVDLASQLEPRIVIPMAYAVAGIKLPLDKPDAFCKELGIPCEATDDRLKIEPKDLPEDAQQIILLKAARGSE